MSPAEQEFAKTLGGRIRMARFDAGMKQIDLACVIGVTAPCLSNYERGVRIPGVETLAAIVAALGTTFDRLVPAVEVWQKVDDNQMTFEEG